MVYAWEYWELRSVVDDSMRWAAFEGLIRGEELRVMRARLRNVERLYTECKLGDCLRELRALKEDVERLRTRRDRLEK
jgi:hypothetical protein